MQLAMVRASHLAFTIQAYQVLAILENPTFKSPPEARKGRVWGFRQQKSEEKYLKVSIAISGRLRTILQVKTRSAEISQMHKKGCEITSQQKRLILQRCEVGFQLAGVRLPMAVTPSFQLRIAHRSAPKVADMTVIKNASWQISLYFLSLHSGFAYGKGLQSFVLERVSSHPSIVSGRVLRIFSNEIDVEDQEKTTFTCPFGNICLQKNAFGLCNAPGTFQRCMLSIFSDMVERIMEVFMDDITIYEGIVLSHIIFAKGIEVDKAKVELIVKLLSPTTVKGVRQFLGHAGFYRRFIKDFSNLSKPLCELLAKDAKFIWDERCQKSFDQLKQFLTTTPIVRAPNWQLPFEVMCDASDFAIGVVLGQRKDGKPYVIYYASKTLNEAQRNYTTTKKEC
ncbi:Retrovirus-related Pol polyprotein from transposon 17.6 [Vitis vinifera]|uniref:Retrovirus-related Pol polyprotein from transposon 17.6 n=1 Tax=Vitis vinifera TaxID=29760 RepID=A0A438G4R7_VITVI|nr:Retrovirus-related Pol polyprotein from transposon 17.6 [Vitis vinifera]